MVSQTCPILSVKTEMIRFFAQNIKVNLLDLSQEFDVPK